MRERGAGGDGAGAAGRSVCPVVQQEHGDCKKTALRENTDGTYTLLPLPMSMGRFSTILHLVRSYVADVSLSDSAGRNLVI